MLKTLPAVVLTFLYICSFAYAHDGDGKSLSNAAAAGSGGSGPYSAKNVALQSRLTLGQVGAGSSVLANDIWGWEDSNTGRRFALLGLTNATSFIEVTDPTAPIYLGKLNTHEAGQNRAWRDIKVYKDHAFIVADGGGNDHGMQVFDLSQLLTANPKTPTEFSETGHYNGFANAHNIAINEGSGFAYVVGGPSSGGLHILDIRDVGNIQYAGEFSGDGYTHDAQIVNYAGPDASYANREIAFAANEDTLTIVDVTDKDTPSQISRTGYADRGYSHQGWLSEDHRYFFMDDELDEVRHVRGPDGRAGTDDDNDPRPTRTFIWDVQDLDNPVNIGFFEGTEKTIDHNLYVKDGFIYQANYTSGLRILQINDAANGDLEEWGFFDTYMADNNVSFNGAWSVFPFFDSSTILVSDRQGGLFVLKTVPEPSSVSIALLSLAFVGLRRKKRV